MVLYFGPPNRIRLRCWMSDSVTSVVRLDRNSAGNHVATEASVENNALGGRLHEFPILIFPFGRVHDQQWLARIQVANRSG